MGALAVSTEPPTVAAPERALERGARTIAVYPGDPGGACRESGHGMLEATDRGAQPRVLAALPNAIFMESGLLPENGSVKLLNGCYPLPEVPGFGG